MEVRMNIRSHFIICVLSVFLFVGCSNNYISNPEHYVTDTHSIKYITTGTNYYNDGVIYGSENAMYLDFKTMETSPICAVPNCKHNDSECLSYKIGRIPIMYNDSIYFFESSCYVKENSNGRELIRDTKLMKTNLNSSSISVVCKFDDCCPTKSYDGYLLYDNFLYFVGDDMNPIKDDYGNLMFSNIGGVHYLCSINLINGEYKNHGSIYDGDKVFESASSTSTAHISGYYDGKMFIEYSFSDGSIFNVDNSQHFEPLDYFTILNFEYDFDSEVMCISDLPHPSYMNEDTYVYSDYKNDTTTVIHQNNTYTIDDMDAGFYAREFNGNIFFYSCWYDLKTLTKHNMKKYEDYIPVAYYNNKYIFMNGGRHKAFSESELLALDKE